VDGLAERPRALSSSQLTLALSRGDPNGGREYRSLRPLKVPATPVAFAGSPLSPLLLSLSPERRRGTRPSAAVGSAHICWKGKTAEEYYDPAPYDVKIDG